MEKFRKKAKATSLMQPGVGEGLKGLTLSSSLSSESLSHRRRALIRKGHMGFSGSQNGGGSIAKYVFKLVAMEICFKDSY